MPASSGPSFRSLTRTECDALLARHHVGRLAFAFHDRVDIQPIHYVYEAGWLFGRTSEGAKLAMLEHNRWVAFEVDEARAPFEWASVVVHGTFQRLDPNGTPQERAAIARAVHLLRAVVPGTFTADDPAEFRTVLFRISIGEMTGRRASPTAGAGDATRERVAAPRTSDRAAPPDSSGW